MSESRFSHLNVLVIDDDPYITSIVKMALEQLGVVNISTVDNGKEAIDKLNDYDKSFHVIICDLYMPNMDGIEFLRHLAELEFNGGVILFSGANERILKAAVNVARAHFLNVLGSMQKPVHMKTLENFLDHFDTMYGFTATKTRTSLLTQQEVREGLVNGDNLILYYQPQIDIKSGKVVGSEALARWKHPVYGIVGPAAFVPLAEHGELTEIFTQAVVRKALDQMVKWRKEGKDIKVAINISPKSLKLDLPDFIERSCKERSIPHELIMLEITETHLDEDVVMSLEVLTRLSLRGFSLSIDDFGTGYSSLDRLKQVPFDELKIDSSFVHGASLDSAAKVIFESSVVLGKQLSLMVVAEGVETKDDLKLTGDLGCNIAQGYLIAKPMDVKDFDEWLSNWKGLGSL